MKIGRVAGAVVTPLCDVGLVGCKLLLLREVGADWRVTGVAFVAVDTIGAGPDDFVLVATGDAARLTERTRNAPVDAAIVAIVHRPDDTPEER